jgi:peptide/nickel transport system ATP-binding protein
MTSVLEIQNLNVNYHSSRGSARAVRDLSLTINGGETYGLVGESGCGKSTVALSISRARHTTAAKSASRDAT